MLYFLSFLFRPKPGGTTGRMREGGEDKEEKAAPRESEIQRSIFL